MLTAIVGSGPAGCALSCFLADRGYQCIVFDDDKRPELLVGESLVPAVMPYLRRLGIEAEVASISVKKFGAALRHADGPRVNFIFRNLNQSVPDYSYNIPRPDFDRLLRKRAEQLGVRFISHRARLEKTDSPDRDIQLSPESFRAAGLTEHPDLLVDATGRHRLFSRLLSIPAEKGQRDNISYFAHYENFAEDNVVPGQVVLSVIESGWSWQIPLKNGLSVGVVIDKRSTARYGASPEQRLERIIDSDPILSHSGKQRKRVSHVMAYSNYQLMTKQGYGKGWVLVGDAYGFVDPMLSPGVFMALESAALLDKFIATKQDKEHRVTDLTGYCREMDRWHRSWASAIEYFYDGRLLSLFEAGQSVVKNSHKWSFARIMEWHLRRIIASIVSGVGTRSRYKQLVLFHSCKHILGKNQDNKEYAINNDSLELAGKHDQTVCFD